MNPTQLQIFKLNNMVEQQANQMLALINDESWETYVKIIEDQTLVQVFCESIRRSLVKDLSIYITTSQLHPVHQKYYFYVSSAHISQSEELSVVVKTFEELLRVNITFTRSENSNTTTKKKIIVMQNTQIQGQRKMVEVPEVQNEPKPKESNQTMLQQKSDQALNNVEWKKGDSVSNLVNSVNILFQIQELDKQAINNNKLTLVTIEAHPQFGLIMKDEDNHRQFYESLKGLIQAGNEGVMDVYPDYDLMDQQQNFLGVQTGKTQRSLISYLCDDQKVVIEIPNLLGTSFNVTLERYSNAPKIDEVVLFTGPFFQTKNYSTFDINFQQLLPDKQIFRYRLWSSLFIGYFLSLVMFQPKNTILSFIGRLSAFYEEKKTFEKDQAIEEVEQTLQVQYEEMESLIKKCIEEVVQNRKKVIDNLFQDRKGTPLKQVAQLTEILWRKFIYQAKLKTKDDMLLQNKNRDGQFINTQVQEKIYDTKHCVTTLSEIFRFAVKLKVDQDPKQNLEIPFKDKKIKLCDFSIEIYEQYLTVKVQEITQQNYDFKQV